MRTPLMISALAAMPLAACSSYGDSGPRYGSSRPYDDGYRGGNAGGGYVLSDDDAIYRDRDGRYYCKRRDGTTGTIVGGLAGGVLGNIIAPGGSKTLGTILGAAGGAIAGNIIDKRNVRCE